MQQNISKATLGRLPSYLSYMKAIDSECISAPKLAKALGYGEVQVRKDLNAVSGTGKPKTGYDRLSLISDLEKVLGARSTTQAVLVGAGKLGLALLGYNGFLDYGLEIVAAFDTNADAATENRSGKNIYPVDGLRNFCMTNGIKLGIITVPASEAQRTADELISSGVSAIWNFAPCRLKTPAGVNVKQENLALSLAHLKLLSDQ